VSAEILVDIQNKLVVEPNPKEAIFDLDPPVDPRAQRVAVPKNNLFLPIRAVVTALDVQVAGSFRPNLGLNSHQVRGGVVDLEEAHPRLLRSHVSDTGPALHPVQPVSAIPRGQIAVKVQLTKLGARVVGSLAGPAVVHPDPELHVPVFGQDEVRVLDEAILDLILVDVDSVAVLVPVFVPVRDTDAHIEVVLSGTGADPQGISGTDRHASA